MVLAVAAGGAAAAAGVRTPPPTCRAVFGPLSPAKDWLFPFKISKDGPKNSKHIVCISVVRITQACSEWNPFETLMNMHVYT